MNEAVLRIQAQTRPPALKELTQVAVQQPKCPDPGRGEGQGRHQLQRPDDPKAHGTIVC